MGFKYFLAERGVYDHLNALLSDSVTDAQTSLTATSLTLDTIVMNPMYSPYGVRKQLLNFERIIGRAICATEGHPRRKDFLSVQKLAHLDALPSSVGGIGSVWDTEGGSATGKYLTPRTPEVVRELRDTANQIAVKDGEFTENFAFGFDGSRFFHTLTRQVSVEVYTLTAMPSTFAGIQALFDAAAVTPSESFLPDEFQGALEYGTAGICAMKVGTFPEEASGFLQLARTLLEELGVTFKIPQDFAATASPAQ
jgi:hypothetical protein